MRKIPDACACNIEILSIRTSPPEEEGEVEEASGWAMESRSCTQRNLNDLNAYTRPCSLR